MLFSFLFGNSAMNAQSISMDLTYIRVEIKGMACPFCAGGMGKSLEALDGVQKVDMAFDHGLAFITVQANRSPSKEDLKEIVTESGFKIGSIEYSEEPFEIPLPSKLKKKKKKVSG